MKFHLSYVCTEPDCQSDPTLGLMHQTRSIRERIVIMFTTMKGITTMILLSLRNPMGSVRRNQEIFAGAVE